MGFHNWISSSLMRRKDKNKNLRQKNHSLHLPNPRAATSVATKIGARPERNSKTTRKNTKSLEKTNNSEFSLEMQCSTVIMIFKEN